MELSTNDMLDTRAVAALAGVAPNTIKGYHQIARGGHLCMPVADLYVGRTPIWSRSTIDEWLISRGQGAGGVGRAVAAGPDGVTPCIDAGPLRRYLRHLTLVTAGSGK